MAKNSPGLKGGEFLSVLWGWLGDGCFVFGGFLKKVWLIRRGDIFFVQIFSVASFVNGCQDAGSSRCQDYENMFRPWEFVKARYFLPQIGILGLGVDPTDAHCFF